MITFHDDEYRTSHGRAPRGRGWWIFAPFGQTDVRHESSWFESSGTLTEAKRALRASGRDGDWMILP